MFPLDFAFSEATVDELFSTAQHHLRHRQKVAVLWMDSLLRLDCAVSKPSDQEMLLRPRPPLLLHNPAIFYFYGCQHSHKHL